VRRRKIAGVEQVLDVELQRYRIGEADEGGGIDAGIGGQGDGVADRGEARRLVDDAEAEAEAVGDVIAGPRRRLGARHQRHLAAGGRGAGGGADFGILPGKAGGKLPLRRDLAVGAEFEALAALFAGQFDGAGDGAGGAAVGAIELVDGGGEVEAGGDIPFGADFVIVEAFGFEIGEAGIEREELVARLRQVGAAVAGIERGVADRLEDQPEARRPEIVGAAEGGVGEEVGEIEAEAIITQAGKDLDMVADLDLVLDCLLYTSPSPRDH
jgi:hypothetical protein